MKLSLKDKALRVVEVMSELASVEKTTLDPDEVYRLVHVGTGTCNNPHPDWVKELEDTYQAFKEGNLL